MLEPRPKGLRLLPCLGDAMAALPSTSQQLEGCASALHSIAFDFLEPARDHQASDRRIDEVEQICVRVRAAVRGRG